MMLLDLEGRGMEQGQLELEPKAPIRGDLMDALDKPNDRHGRATGPITTDPA